MGGMHKTSTSLADGRSLTYYDGQPAERETTDRRELPGTETQSELRYDPLTEEWVAIAAHRQGRTHLPSTAECPLCPSRDGRLTEIPSSDYAVVVFDNRFPSLTGSAGGHCEVVVFSSEHTASLGDLPPERVNLLLDAWADRTTELGARPGVEQVFPFENRGVEVGVTLHHPHGQIYAFPFIPPRARRSLDAARRHRERTGRNLFADVLATEKAAQTRIVAESEHWTAFVPEAARWPVELHVYPNRQVPDLPALSEPERADFARLYPELLRRLDRLYDQPLPYLAGWQQAPVHVDRDLAYLRLELVSPRRAPAKLKYLASVETLMGAFLNDVQPEETARRLRELAR